MTRPLLRVESLSWAPPDSDTPIFEGVTLEVRPGERVVLKGPSGSGKSTLLRCIVGLEPRRTGELFWRGEPVGPDNMRRFRSRAVYVQQRPSEVAETVGQNLAFAREMAEELGSGEALLDESEQREMFARLGLENIGHSRRFDDLSVGEQQRVCLVRALTGGPDVLLLDEPTSALDPERVEQIEELLTSYVDQAPESRAFVWVSHQPQQIERLAGRVVDLAQWTADKRTGGRS